MPESRGRPKKMASDPVGARKATPNPSWYVPVMVGLMVVGLLWIVTYYLTQAVYPVPALGNWNLAIGFGLIIAGFLMTTNWR